MDLPALCAFLGLEDPGVIDRDALPPFLREVWLATRASDAAEDAGASRICAESVPDNTIPPEALSELGEQVERLKVVRHLSPGITRVRQCKKCIELSDLARLRG